MALAVAAAAAASTATSVAASAAAAAMAAASSSYLVISHKKYDVFLSFRGDDTRKNFTCHLYKELHRYGITTFIDDDIKRGDEIPSTIQKVIEESKVSLIIFSENYASSSWCLDELVHIIQCKEQTNQVVMPIFFNVDPSSVRKQVGSYDKAFAELKKRFNDENRILAWRYALEVAANLSGWDSRNFR